MRATTAFSQLLALLGVTVAGVDFGSNAVVVNVRLRRRRLECPECDFTTPFRYDTRPVESFWRHLDLGAWHLEVRAWLRRLQCPTHGVRTEAVPFARPGSHFTRDFEDLVGWLATTMDKKAITRLVRVDWDTVGRILTRVMDDGLDPNRLEGLFEIGVDEVSWRKHHKYLTLVSNYRDSTIIWGAEGKDAATLDQFFDGVNNDCPPEAEAETKTSEQIKAVSMDMSAAFAKSVSEPGHASKAVICYDPFHVVQLATKALDKVRREVWQELRKETDQTVAKRYKGARWALLKNPTDLNDDQASMLRRLKRRGGDLWRAYTLKEALRAVFAGDLSEDDVGYLLDRFCSRASRSGLTQFVKVAKTIRRHRSGILAAVRLGVNNARHEGLNRRVRLIINRAYGFHSAKAALALIMVTLGPIEHVLPSERLGVADP